MHKIEKWQAAAGHDPMEFFIFFVKSSIYLELPTGKSMASNLSYGLKTLKQKKTPPF